MIFKESFSFPVSLLPFRVSVSEVSSLTISLGPIHQHTVGVHGAFQVPDWSIPDFTSI